MALIHVSASSLCKLSGLKPQQIEPTLTSLGIPLEGQEGDDLSLEITPNRPDWLSVEGIARSAYSWRTAKPKIYKASSAKLHFTLDESVRNVRPVLGSALVRNVVLDEESLQSLIQLQEKLHDTLGRGRRKMAIGLHDMMAIRPPFTYKAVGRSEARFVPLGKSAPMTPGQILVEHEKGRAYAHLIGERCPMIVDADGDVLSFPPIINGERTRVTLSSHDLLIDCTGTSEQAVRVTVNILCAALADRGGQVEEVKINSKPYRVFEPQVMPLPAASAKKLLGVDLDAPALARHLSRMGHEVSGRSVRSPAFRADLLGEADLIEDIAISIGYNELPMPVPSFGSMGARQESAAQLHEAALGLGYFEVMSWILTNHSLLERAKAAGPALRVSNPLTEEFTTLRPWLYPNLLDILAHSKSQPLPIYLYEVGPVLAPREGPSSSAAGDFSQREHFAAISMHPKSCFSEAWAHLQGMGQALGISFALEETDIEGFIPGRSARVCLRIGDGAGSGEQAGGQSASVLSAPIGLIGEVHPSVLESFGLEQPAALFELQALPLIEREA
ncbi:MAG: phenylalanine--tRNA ligase subunit beta [Candidatus Marsarchaeota archaeon]|nr:phenylalanine--tRNA ligase subunit beta [Candidatus Marsarchaeota archaeon]